jgi:hypothetical protein
LAQNLRHTRRAPYWQPSSILCDVLWSCPEAARAALLRFFLVF